MKKVVKKGVVKTFKCQAAFMLTEKLELKLKRIKKQLKLKSMSAAMRQCIEAY